MNVSLTVGNCCPQATTVEEKHEPEPLSALRLSAYEPNAYLLGQSSALDYLST